MELETQVKYVILISSLRWIKTVELSCWLLSLQQESLVHRKCFIFLIFTLNIASQDHSQHKCSHQQSWNNYTITEPDACCELISCHEEKLIWNVYKVCLFAMQRTRWRMWERYLSLFLLQLCLEWRLSDRNGVGCDVKVWTMQMCMTSVYLISTRIYQAVIVTWH
jgi:hypothetical protein